MGPLTSRKGPSKPVWKALEFCCLGFLMEIAQGTKSLISEMYWLYSCQVRHRIRNIIRTGVYTVN